MGISRRIFSQAVQSGTAEISDKLVEFGSTTTGTPSDDVGIIVNRGTSTNAFLGWDESEDKFVAATTSATGASTGNLTLTPTALKCGDLDVDGGDINLPLAASTITQAAQAAGSNANGLTIAASSVTGGSGANNKTGGALTLKGGGSTGSGAGGSIIMQTSPSGGSGNAANTVATVATVTTDGLLMASGKAVATGTVLAADGSDALTLTDSSGNAAFAADVTITGGDLSFGNGQNATMSVADTAHNAAGKNLTFTAGAPAAGTTNNIAGGALTLKGGAGKGSGAGGDIILQVANAGGSGSSINSHATALTISDDKNATFAADVTVAGDIILDDGGSLREAGGTAAITFDGAGNVTKIGQDSPSSSDFLQWDGAKWIATAVSGGGGAVSAVANGADNRIATFSSGDALNGETNLSFDGSTLAVTGALTTTTTATVGTDLTVSGGDITYGNGQNATLGITATAHNAAGKILTVSGGPTTAGTTNDIAGGDLVLSGGQGKGAAAGGSIKFQIAESAAGAASSLNAFVETMVLDDPGTLTIKRDMDSDYTALKLYNQSDSNNTNGKVSMQFSLEDTSGNEVDAGKITCEKEAAFTSTAGTQDAKFQWQLSLNGTMTDAMELSSGGDLTTAGDVTVGGALYASQYMYHSSDTDTKLEFTVDQINLIAGNVNMLKLKETTQNECVFFEGGDNVDFRIEAASAAYFFFIDSGDNKAYIGGNTANKLTSQMLNVQDGNIAIGKNAADANASEFIFAKSRHATDGNVTTAVNAADNIGEIVFQGSDGDELVIAAKIVGGIDYGTPANNDMPGKLSFYTTPDGSATPTEALRINQGQHVVLPNGSLLVQSSANGTELGAGTNAWAGIAIDYFATAYDGKDGGRLIIRGDSSNSDKGTFVISQALNNNSSTLESVQIDEDGNVKVTGGSVASISDSRIKENVSTLGSVISKVMQLNPVEFDWGDPIKNKDPARTSNHDFGFVAQEMELIYPDMINTGGVSNDDMPDNIKSMTYTSMIPILTKAIQEQQALIVALTARVAALES